MSTAIYNVNVAVSEFLKAFCDYQKATLDMHQSLARLSNQTNAFCQPLKGIIHVSGAAITPRNYPAVR